MLKVGTVYLITNIINNKLYVGSTYKNINIRFNEHIKEAKLGRSNSLLHKAIIKYGVDNFRIEAICSAIEVEDNLYYLEDHFINYYKTLSSNNNYNLVYAKQGVGSRPHISQAMKVEWVKNRETRMKSFASRKIDPVIEKERIRKCKEAHNTPEAKAKRAIITKELWATGKMDSTADLIKQDWSKPAKRKERLKAMREGSTHRFKSIIRVHVHNGAFQIYTNVNDAKRDGYSSFGIYDSLKNPGRKGQNNLWFYYKDNDHQEYVKQAEILLGRFKTEYSDPVKMENIKTGKITILENVGKVSDYNLEVKRVTKCLKGQRQSCGGYRFSYIHS